MKFSQIGLALIEPSKMNPRKHGAVASAKDLALIASVKAKGVIEPIIVRPKDKKISGYEIVAGERRYRAAFAAGLEFIPAVVRDLTDDEAYDFMLIENLQREDLTDREEAESFKAYISRHGEGAIQDLAEKTGIAQGYIRARVRVLELPTAVLKAWEKGDLVFGHLHQLLRVTDEKEFKKTIGWALQQLSWERSLTVKDLARQIDGDAPALSGAFFGTKETCAKCPGNSIVQKDLFDIDMKGAHCLKSGCFKKHQAEWLTANWKNSAIAKKEGTNGFRFHEDVSYDGYCEFYEWNRKRIGKKCRECPDFVTILELSGKVDAGKACAGKKTCYDAVTNPRSSKEQETGERDPEAPRAAWHGEYFRDVFLSKRIPEALAKIDPDDPKIKVLLLACAIHGNRSEISVREDYSGGILTKSADELLKAYKGVIEKVVLSGQHVGPSHWNGFGTKGRRLVAEYLGIDLAKEFAVTEEYLQKKTKAEIIAFGKKFRIFSDLNVAAHVARTIGKTPGNVVVADFNSLKKTDLINVVLKSGVDLVGKVPAEILKEGKP
jgi:ParB/RepB/Spo0J family partition protein